MGERDKGGFQHPPVGDTPVGFPVGLRFFRTTTPGVIGEGLCSWLKRLRIIAMK
jgi:hypothetical protein